jgi:AraC-like DNA-binding protein
LSADKYSGTTWNELVLAALSNAGLDGQSLVEKHGLAPDASMNSSAQYLNGAYNRLWDEAVRLTGDPTIGLYAPDGVAYGLGPLCQLVLSAETIESAFEALSRHFSLISPCQYLGFQQRKTDVWELELGFVECNAASSPRYDLFSLVLLTQMRILTGCPLVPCNYFRPGRVPEKTNSWEAAFQCPVEFGSKFCTIVLPASYLEYPIPTANSAVFDICDKSAQSAHLSASGNLRSKVHKRLAESLPAGELKREDIASCLGVSVRSLNRRLAREGSSFAQILSDVRRELAEMHLKHGNMTHSEISYALGFGDPSNFYRSCKRWFGCTPGKLR